MSNDPGLTEQLREALVTLGVAEDELPEDYDADALVAAAAAKRGQGAEGWEAQRDAILAGTAMRPQGRPRASSPAIDWQAIDKALVHGELRDGPDGSPVLHYPTDTEIARRANVDRSTIRKYRQRSNADERRGRVQERTEALVEEHMATTAAAAIAEGRERALRICDKYLRKFEETLDAGKLRADSVADLNTVVRLMEFASGGADSRTQTEHAVTLEAVQKRFKQRRIAYAAEASPAMGVAAPPLFGDAEPAALVAAGEEDDAGDDSQGRGGEVDGDSDGGGDGGDSVRAEPRDAGHG